MRAQLLLITSKRWQDITVLISVVLLAFLLLYRLLDYHTLESASCVNICSTQHAHHLFKLTAQENTTEPAPKKRYPPATISYPQAPPTFEVVAAFIQQTRSLTVPLYLIYENMRF